MQKNNDKDIKNDIVFDEETTQNNADNDKEQSDVQQCETVCQTDETVDEQESDNGGILAEYAKHENKGKKALAVVKKYCKRYFIDAFSGMAQGLFCTLIAGTILAQIASWCGDNSFAKVLGYIASIAKMLMGAGIGIGIAHKLGAKPLVIFTAAVTGLVGAFAGNLVGALCDGASFTIAFGAVGNPVGAYVVSLLTVEIASLYAGKTKLDIILIPLGMMLLCLAGIFLAWPFIKLIDFGNRGRRGSQNHCRRVRCGGYGYFAHYAHVVGGNLGCNRNKRNRNRKPRRIRNRGRCGSCGLFGAYDWFCRGEFQRKRRRRSYLARHRHKHASNPQYNEKTCNYGARNRGKCGLRTGCRDYGASLQRIRRRHGHERSCGCIRHDRRIARGDTRLATWRRNCALFVYPSCRNLVWSERTYAQNRRNQIRRSKTRELIKTTKIKRVFRRVFS